MEVTAAHHEAALCPRPSGGTSNDGGEQDFAVVVVSRAAAAPKAPLSDSAVGRSPLPQSLVKDVEDRLNVCQRVVSDLGAVVTPWTRKKNVKQAEAVAALLEGQATSLRAVLSSAVSQSELLLQDAEVARSHAVGLAAKVAEKDKVIAALEAERSLKDDRIESLAHRVAELKQAQVDAEERVRAVVGVVGGAVGAATYYENKDEQLATLVRKVDQLVAEHAALQACNDKLSKSRDDLSKQKKDLATKLRDVADVSEREIRRLTAELRKAAEAKEQELRAAREQAAEQLGGRVKEQRALQQRHDALKATVEQLKGEAKGTKAQLDKVNAAMAKAAEDAEAQRAKHAESKRQRDVLAADLEHMRVEHAMLRDELKAATPAGAAAKEHEMQAYYNTAASWPRYAFTSRHGACVHSRACTPGLDTTKVLPFEYRDHKELEAKVAEHGLFLCHNCRSEPGF